MRTKKQREASRNNGAQSRGPITEKGRQISSQNALSHGLTAKTVLLSNEDPEELNRLLEAYRARYQPADPVESGVVEEMVAIRWRQNRLWAHEAALLDSEMDHMAGPIAQKYLHIDDATRRGLAFKQLADNSTSLELVRRYDAHYSRAYARACQHLSELQAARRNENLQNEPEQVASPAKPVVCLPVRPVASTPGPSSDSRPRATTGPRAPVSGSVSLQIHDALELHE